MVKKRISLEIPLTGIERKWEKTLQKFIRKTYKKHAAPKSDLKKCVEEHIKARTILKNAKKR